MLIWLGKNLLGQTDRQQFELTPGQTPVPFEYDNDELLKRLSDMSVNLENDCKDSPA